MLVLESGAENLVLPVCTYAKKGRIGIVCVGLDIALGRHIIVVLGKLTEVHHIKALGLA